MPMSGLPLQLLTRSLGSFARRVRSPFFIGAIVSALAVATEVQAGMMVSAEQVGSIDPACDGLSAAPCGAPSKADRGDEVEYSKHDALPNGAGASSGPSAPPGAAPFAAILTQCEIQPQLQQSSSIEERSLSLPDSPVRDRLRPPRA